MIASSSTTAKPGLRLPHIFGDHMVLQRDLPIPVWGWAAPGEDVTVSLGTNSATAQADAQGRWMVRLKPMKASTNGRVLTVTSAISTRRSAMSNVLVGDVWLCGGQSNMEWLLRNCDSPNDVAQAAYPAVRCIKVPLAVSAEPKDDFEGAWRVSTPETAGDFTAVGFYFAREIHRETGVPIGIIDDNWGGTCIEPWCTPESFGTEPGLAALNAEFERAMNTYRATLDTQWPTIEARVAAIKKALELKERELPAPPEWPAYPVYTPGTAFGRSCLFNSMIHPVAPYAIKGALWYQGESNGGDGDIYCHKMRALICGWRTLWNQGDFPFYYVQLANWEKDTNMPEGGDGWAKIRSAQTKALSIPKTGMAVTVDIGEADDIHPKNKFDVGKRLSLWALANDYGKKGIEVSGPLYKRMEIEGKTIRIGFDHAAGGLMVGKKTGKEPAVEAKGGKLKRFAIAGTDRKWVWADAKIDGSTVVVSSKKVAKPVAVRYAFTMNPEGSNLYNKAGLPASPFRTDGW